MYITTDKNVYVVTGPNIHGEIVEIASFNSEIHAVNYVSYLKETFGIIAKRRHAVILDYQCVYLEGN